MAAQGPCSAPYLAIVWGFPRRPHGTITTQIERSNKNREKMMVVGEDRGREAITHFTVIERYPPLLKGGEETEALASPGRMPAGDRPHPPDPRAYEPSWPSAARRPALRLGILDQGVAAPRIGAAPPLIGLGRQALHAAVLGFEHPASGEELLFESELPPEFAQLQAALAAL